MTRLVTFKCFGAVLGNFGKKKKNQAGCLPVPIRACESNSIHFLSNCLNKNKTFLWRNAVRSINHSQGEEILCKVFGDDSWLVGAPERELGLAIDVESWHSCPRPPLCMCLCVSAWGVWSRVAGGRLPVSGEETITYCMHLASCVYLNV